MSREPVRDWYVAGQRPDWCGPARRRNRNLPASGAGRDFGNIISFITGALLMLCAVLAITGWHI